MGRGEKEDVMSRVHYEKNEKNIRFSYAWLALEHLLAPLEQGLKHAPWVLGHYGKNSPLPKIWKFFSSQEELERYLKSFRQEGF